MSIEDAIMGGIVFKGKKDNDIVVGDSQYLPVCRNCYNKLINGEI